MDTYQIHQYYQINLHVPWCTLKVSHPATVECARVAERMIRRLEEEELREIVKMAFEAYGSLLTNLMVFKYMVWVMVAVDYD